MEEVEFSAQDQSPKADAARLETSTAGEAAARATKDLGPNAKRSRPSVFGVVIGEALAKLDAAGRAASADELPPTCATCAFRAGCMTNQMPETGLVAFKCAVGADPDGFACHHGMRDGQPTRLCAGYYAAKKAPWEAVQAISAEMTASMPPVDAPDPVREAFDAWITLTDPTGQLDDYERGRLYLRAFPDGVGSRGTNKYNEL